MLGNELNQTAGTEVQTTVPQFTEEQLKQQANAQTTTSISLPKKVEVKGIVESYSTRKGVDGKIATIKTLDGKTVDLIINSNQASWDGFKDIVEGSDFTFTCEEVIKDKTGWLDKTTGKLVAHKADSMKVVGCKKAFKREVGMKILEDKMMAVFNSSEGNVELTGVFGNAFAQFLK